MFDMIYEPISLEDDLRQGDLFCNLPFVYFNLDELSVFNDESSFEQTSWADLIKNEIHILASVEKTYAIILSQDCDCLRNEFISLCIISEWNKKYTSSKKWMKEIIKLNKFSPSKMYLPPDISFNIEKKMYADFSLIFHIDRENLENLKNLRICRLNEDAMEHFREKVAYYFHRYAFDEFYPLDKDEMDQYEKTRGEKYERRVHQK